MADRATAEGLPNSNSTNRLIPRIWAMCRAQGARYQCRNSGSIAYAMRLAACDLVIGTQVTFGVGFNMPYR